MGIFTQVMKRATPENPSFDLNSPDAWDLLGVEKSASGVRVDQKSALSFPPFWRAVNLISGTVGKTPLHTYKRVSNQYGEGKEKDKSHPAYHLLRYEPNEEQTVDVLIGVGTGHAVTKGNGYVYIERRDMEPYALWVLNPDCTFPVRANGKLWYVWMNDGVAVRIDPMDIIHIKGFGYDGLVGYNVIDLLKDAIGLGIAQHKFMAAALKNGASPRVMLEAPGNITPEQATQIRDGWEKMHTGIDSAHRTAILRWGVKANVIGFSPDDIKLIDSRGLSIIDVANIAGLPVHKVGGEGSRSYASLEQENLAFLADSIDFWFTRWENELRKKLLTEKEKKSDSHAIEFLRAALVRMDSAATALYNRAALGGHPWETVNEARSRQNKNPVEGGDVVPEPLNFGNSGGQDNTPTDPAADPVKPQGPNSGGGDLKKKRISDSVFALLGDAQRRVIHRVSVHATAAAKRGAREFGQWIDRMESEHQGPVRSILAPAFDAWHASYEVEADPQRSADQFLAELRESLLEMSGTVTKPSELCQRIAAWAAERENHGTSDS